MTERTLVFGMGATKAGTTWLYQTLHHHPDCHLRSVKELHYWNSFDAEEQAYKLGELRDQMTALRAQQAAALVSGDGWKTANLDRRLQDCQSLATVLAGDRTGDGAYLDWLQDGAGAARLIGDITPAYALLPEPILSRMVDLVPDTRFIFLIRDPLARLWSHVRMAAARSTREGRALSHEANNILARILTKRRAPHVTARGDYPAIVSRLTGAVPPDRLFVGYMESLVAPGGQGPLAAFLGLPGLNGRPEPVHVGLPADMRADLVQPALALLRPHYDWALQTVGPLPSAWLASLARAA